MWAFGTQNRNRYLDCYLGLGNLLLASSFLYYLSQQLTLIFDMSHAIFEEGVDKRMFRFLLKRGSIVSLTEFTFLCLALVLSLLEFSRFDCSGHSCLNISALEYLLFGWPVLSLLSFGLFILDFPLRLGNNFTQTVDRFAFSLSLRGYVSMESSLPSIDISRPLSGNIFFILFSFSCSFKTI